MPSLGSRSRSISSVLLALGMHALLIAAAARATKHAAPRLRDSYEAAIELDVDLPASVGASTATSAAPIGSALARLERLPRALEARARADASGELQPQQPTSESTDEGSRSTPESRAAPHLGLEALGIAGNNPLLRAPLAGDPGPMHPQSVAPSIDQSLAQGLADHDAPLGYGPQGPILRELIRLSRLTTTPDNSSALFFAAIDEKGRLADLRVLSVSAGHREYEDVARRTRAALRGRKLSLPQGAHGMELRIAVTSRVQLPSGADPGLAVSALGIPLKKGGGKRSAHIGILDPIFELGGIADPSDNGETPGLPSIKLGFIPFSFGGDAADIGAVSRRMVHARVVDQKVL